MGRLGRVAASHSTDWEEAVVAHLAFSSRFGQTRFPKKPSR